MPKGTPSKRKFERRTKAENEKRRKERQESPYTKLDKSPTPRLSRSSLTDQMLAARAIFPSVLPGHGFWQRFGIKAVVEIMRLRNQLHDNAVEGIISKALEGFNRFGEPNEQFEKLGAFVTEVGSSVKCDLPVFIDGMEMITEEIRIVIEAAKEDRERLAKTEAH